MPIQFRGPQAFLLGKGEALRWKKTKLEAMHTVSYALTGARHTFFIPAEGNVLGESIFAIDNQGASDVKLPLTPDPTYVSIENEALLMTKGPDGKLTVPLSDGKQQVLVQHRQRIRHLLGFGFGRLVVPQLGVPASSLLATINYPRQWVPLLQSFSTRTKFWIPSTEQMLIFLALLLWTERLLAWLGLPLRKRLTIAVLVGAASASFDLILGLVTLGDAFLTIAWLVPYFKRLVATVIVIAGVLVFVFNLQTRRSLESMSSSGGGIASVARKPMLNREQEEFGNEASQQQGALNISAKAEAGNVAFGYQGLPARFEIPGGERHSYFGQELLATDREHAITVILVSSTIVWLIGMSFVALAGWTVWKSRRVLAEGVRSRLAVPSPSPEVAA